MQLYKQRRQIKIRTIIPIVIIIVLVLIAVGLSIVSDNEAVSKILSIMAPFAVFLIYLFLVHGYAMHMTLVEKEEVSNFILLFTDGGAIGTGILAAIAFLAGYITCKKLVSDSIDIYYNIAVFIIALVLVFSAGFCVGECNKALHSKNEYEKSKYHLDKAGKYKYMNVIASIVMVVLTYLITYLFN